MFRMKASLIFLGNIIEENSEQTNQFYSTQTIYFIQIKAMKIINFIKIIDFRCESACPYQTIPALEIKVCTTHATKMSVINNVDEINLI